MKILTMLALLVVWAVPAFAVESAPAADKDKLKTEGAGIPFLGIVQSGIAPELAQTPPAKVAVLPAIPSEKVRNDFAKSKDVDPVAIFRTVFFGRFSVCPYEDVHIKEVDRVLAAAATEIPVSSEQRTPQELGNLLGVDALVYLDIEKAENVSSGVYSYTGYDATARMVRASDGKELWRAKLDFANRGGVVLKSSEALAFVEFEQENQDRKKAFRRAAEEWGRRVVKDLREKIDKSAKEKPAEVKEVARAD